MKGVRQKPLPACSCTLNGAAPRTGNLSAAPGEFSGVVAIGLQVRFLTCQQFPTQILPALALDWLALNIAPNKLAPNHCLRVHPGNPGQGKVGIFAKPFCCIKPRARLVPAAANCPRGCELQ